MQANQIYWDPFLRPGEIPIICPPPNDPGLHDRIEKTVKFAVVSGSTGPAFLLNLVKIHASDPSFSFLWPSDVSHAFFKRRLYDALMHAAQQQQWHQSQQMPWQSKQQHVQPIVLPLPLLPMVPPSAPPDPPKAAAVEPVSSFTFPPGLLPKLCGDKGKVWAPYRPLETEDIERAGLPPPPSTNEYLRSQIDRFFAEVQDYRPGDGLVRTTLDDSTSSASVLQDREGDRDGGATGGSRIRRYYKQVTVKAGMLDDGSFAGASVGQHAGLGISTTTEEDVYATYRRSISTGYHEMIRSGDGQGHSNIARGGR